MSRVLSATGNAAGDGLLKRALELRNRVQATVTVAPAARTLPASPHAVLQTDAEKKKPSRQYLEMAA